ncbi:MAG TPA: hypothetical protein VK564_08675 [Thermodesulfobacteriota bacterium]|nr:hypothetical protein [Thermodesulfobacteriota bacterium]
MKRTVIRNLILCAILMAICVTTPALAQDSCSLLTKADIQAVVGQPVGDGKLNMKANPAVGRPCEYIIGTSGVFSILMTAVRPGETPAKIRAELQKHKIAVSDAPGMADGSFFSSPGYGMIQLNSFKGSKYLIITMMIPGANEATQKTAAEKLMKKALTKI